MLIDNLFVQIPIDTIWFDECKVVTTQTFYSSVATTLTSSINTVDVDAYRQGVELTSMKHYDAGSFKIFAGEIGHQIKQTTYGNQKNFREDSKFFSDIARFNPVDFINLEVSFKQVYSNWPIVVDDYNAESSFDMNGIAEPLTIRSAVMFNNLEHPFNYHSVKGTLMLGNESPFNNVDLVSPISTFDIRVKHSEFYDDGYFDNYDAVTTPFNDIQLTKDFLLSSSVSVDIYNALSQTYVSGTTNMNYTTSDQYIHYNEISATTGFIFDDVQGVGTDSITFGGLVY